MIEFLNTNVLWWHWVVLGILLLGGEVLTGTFLLLGLGISAVAVGALDWIAKLSFTTELLIWALLSTAVIVALKRYWRQRDITDSGQSHREMDVRGTVTETIAPPARGRVTFDVPVLGSREWAAQAEVRIEAGARVEIKRVDGQLMLVVPAAKGA
jgi:membrane protein implicated in regulation of membrane protease activity